MKARGYNVVISSLIILDPDGTRVLEFNFTNYTMKLVLAFASAREGFFRRLNWPRRREDMIYSHWE